MKATLGRTVIVLGVNSNGMTEAPGIITRSWSTQDTASGAVCVNVTVLPDAAPPVAMQSVMLFEDEYRARVHRGGSMQAVAYWPARE